MGDRSVPITSTLGCVSAKSLWGANSQYLTELGINYAAIRSSYIAHIPAAYRSVMKLGNIKEKVGEEHTITSANIKNFLGIAILLSATSGRNSPCIGCACSYLDIFLNRSKMKFTSKEKS